jgi:outer membrane protein assembly factor BamB
LKATSIVKTRFTVVWLLLPLILILLAGCGGRAAMGWSSPVVEEDVVYTASKGGKLYATDINTQQQLWEFPSDRALAGIYSTPVTSGDVLFFGSYEIEVTSFLVFQNQEIGGKAYAVYSTDGQQKWHFPVDGAGTTEPFLGSPALGQDMVYFTSTDHKVYALDVETGAMRWEFETGNQIWGGPAYHDGTVYVGSSDKNLYALNADTGERKWVFVAGGAVYSTPHVSEDTVYFGALDNQAYALNTENGEERWTFQTGNWVWESPLSHEGVVYVPSLDHSMYALYDSNAAVKWQFEAGDMIPGSPVIADGVLYFSANNAGVYALDAETGAPIWHYPEEGDFKVLASPTVAGQLAFVNADDGNLYALDSATGQLRWKVEPGPEQ